jgi:hypothetical protein
MRALDGSVVCDECGGSGLQPCGCPSCKAGRRRECYAGGFVACACRNPLSSEAFHDLLKEEK